MLLAQAVATTTTVAPVLLSPAQHLQHGVTTPLQGDISPQTGPIHWAAIGTGIAATLTLLVAIYAARQVVVAKQALLAQVSSDLWGGWAALMDVREMLASEPDAAHVAARYMSAWRASSHDYYVLSRMPDYFEQIAVLVEVKAVDLEFIKKQLGGLIVLLWNDWHEAIRQVRAEESAAQYGRPKEDSAYRRWELLAQRMATDLHMRVESID